MNEFLNEILDVESKFFEMPYLITHFIIPFVLLGLAFSVIMEKLRIFGSSIIHYLLSFIISFVALTLFNLSSIGNLVGGFSLFAICAFKVSGKKGIIIGIIAAIIYAFLIGWIAELLSPTYY
ncbi:MAG: hypothetical protein QXS37_05435 [Candidatus Aenigmatarchaeota archaeon]